MAKQYLNRSKIAGGLVDYGSLRAPKRVGAVFFQSNGRHPLIDKAGILAGAQMPGGIDATGEGKIIDTAASPLQPSEQTTSCVGSDFKLNRSPSFC